MWYDNPEIGTCVYKVFMPIACGRIIKIEKDTRNALNVPKFYIRWLKDKSVTVESALSVRSYHLLLEDTAKKLETHTKMIRRLITEVSTEAP